MPIKDPEYHKEYYKNNKPKLLEYQKKYGIENKEKIKQYQQKYAPKRAEYRKQYAIKNADRIKKRQRIMARLKRSPEYRFLPQWRIKQIVEAAMIESH